MGNKSFEKGWIMEVKKNYTDDQEKRFHRIMDIAREIKSVTEMIAHGIILLDYAVLAVIEEHGEKGRSSVMRKIFTQFAIFLKRTKTYKQRDDFKPGGIK